MQHRVRVPVQTGIAALALVGVAACHGDAVLSPPIDVVTDVLAAGIACRGGVEAATLSCAASPQGPSDGLWLSVILGGQGSYVLLTSSNVDYDGSQVFRADVTVQNLIGQPVGTADGTSLHPDGVRVFFHTGPTVAAGNGSVSVSNATGTASFTGSNQPYHQYDEVLAPDEVSQVKTWTWDVDPDVETFEFTVFVWAPIQYDDGWVEVAPQNPVLGIGRTETLDATVRDRLGQPVTGRTVTWSSSTPGVADVDPGTGEVSGVAEGTSSVCASSSGPEADGCVTVTVKPVIVVRSLAAPEDPSVGGTSGITLQLDVTQIAEPVTSMVGDVTWNATLLDYLDDASGSIWDLVVTNEVPAGTLKFTAVSASGVTGDVLSALTFSVQGLAVGCTELTPTFSELTAIDPVTFEAIDLLNRALIETEPVTVCVLAP